MDESRTTQTVTVGARYFETLGLPLLRGRALTNADGLPGREAVAVNERFAALHFPGLNPIGRRIRLIGLSATDHAGPWLTIVGVSPSVRQRPTSGIVPLVFLPWRAEPGLHLGVIMRGYADNPTIGNTLREAVREVDPDVAVYNLISVERLSELSRWTPRVMSTLLTLFSGIAMLLAAIALYAVTAYGVAQRTAEIGIRMALGATRGQVSWLFLKGGLWQVGFGLAIGLAGAIAVGQVIRGLLVQTSALDPITFVAVVLALVTVALIACLVPARRAAHLNPVAALRHD